MTVNERIINLIESHDGMTQKILSNTIGVSPSTLNNWLKLGRSIPAEYIKPIADCLGVSCEYLLIGKDDGKISKEDSEWLSLIHQLPPKAKPVFFDSIKGYLYNKEKNGK